MITQEQINHEKRINSILTCEDTSELCIPDHFVVDSWRRCVDDFHLSPEKPPETEVLDAASISHLRDELGEFLEVANEECHSLYQQIAHSGYAIALADTNGVIINTVSDPALDDIFKKYQLQPGAVWSEKYHGTNGLGTCLQTHHPVIIHKDDHFFDNHRILTCTAVPILDPNGNVMAVLDASSLHAKGSKREQIHTRALVRMAANFIEYKYFRRYFKHANLLSFHPRSEFLGVGTEALLALDNDDRILGANARALDHLEIENRELIIHCKIDDILTIAEDKQIRTGLKSGFGIAQAKDVRNGRRYLTMLQPTAKTTPFQLKKSRFKSHITVYPSDKHDCLDLKTLAGNDPHMAYNVRCIRRVVDKNVYILLAGETGTGKEVFSRAIHESSDRKTKPFVALNCAAIPESLIESELFGYKAGAFTGARREGMRGCVLESNGGTLFLDEIGDMPLHLQTRLLRVLETKEVLPLGAQTPVKVDLNVISASHQDLRELINSGAFRKDLYYRLNGITLTLPPLRDRQDIDSLIRCVLAMENLESGPVSVERKAFTRLVEYDWPGNIRELRNVLRTSLALSDDHMIRLADLPKEIVEIAPYSAPTPVPESTLNEGELLDEVPQPDSQLTPLEGAEREAMLQEIKQQRWNMTLTAKKLKMSRSTLYRKLKKYNIPVTQPK